MQVTELIKSITSGSDAAKQTEANTLELLALTKAIAIPDNTAQVNEILELVKAIKMPECKPCEPVEPPVDNSVPMIPLEPSTPIKPNPVEPEPEPEQPTRQIKPILKVKAIATPEEFGEDSDGTALRKAAAKLKALGGGVLVLKANKVYTAKFTAKGVHPREHVVHISDNVFVDMRGATVKLASTVTGSDHDIFSFDRSNNCGIFNGTLIGSAKFSPEGNSNIYLMNLLSLAQAQLELWLSLLDDGLLEYLETHNDKHY